MSPSGTITGVSTTFNEYDIVGLFLLHYQGPYSNSVTSTIGAVGLTRATELSPKSGTSAEDLQDGPVHTGVHLHAKLSSLDSQIPPF